MDSGLSQSYQCKVNMNIQRSVFHIKLLIRHSNALDNPAKKNLKEAIGKKRFFLVLISSPHNPQFYPSNSIFHFVNMTNLDKFITDQNVPNLW